MTDEKDRIKKRVKIRDKPQLMQRFWIWIGTFMFRFGRDILDGYALQNKGTKLLVILRGHHVHIDYVNPNDDEYIDLDWEDYNYGNGCIFEDGYAQSLFAPDPEGEPVTCLNRECLHKFEVKCPVCESDVGSTGVLMPSSHYAASLQTDELGKVLRALYKPEKDWGWVLVVFMLAIGAVALLLFSGVL